MDDADTLWPADIHSAGGFSTRYEASSVPRSHSACRAATREEYGPMDKAIEQIVNARVRLQTGKLLRTDLKGRSASAYDVSGSTLSAKKKLGILLYRKEPN